MLALELGRGGVGGEESFLLEQLHDQLPPAVQSLPQGGGLAVTGSVGRAGQTIALLTRLEHLGVEVWPEESVSRELGC